MKARPKPWERQNGESSQAFAAFTFYRDMAPDERSLRKVADQRYGGSSGKNRQLQVWSSENRWVERAAAWDDEQDRIKLKAQADEAVKAGVNLVKIANASLAKYVEWLSAKKGDKLNDMAAIRLFEIAAKMQRLALGLPSDVSRQEQTGRDGGPIEHRKRIAPGGVDLAKLTDEELALWESLFEKAMPSDSEE